MTISEFLPYSLEIEQAVLGCLINPEYKLYSEILKLEPPDFFEPINRDIFLALKSIVDKNRNISFEGMFDELKVINAHVRYNNLQDYIRNLLSLPVDIDNIEQNVNTLREYRIRRDYFNFIQKQRLDALNLEIDNVTLLAIHNTFMTNLALKSFSDDILSLSQIAGSEFARFVERTLNPQWNRGLSTGYESLDILTKGFAPCDVTVIGGRPSMGKSRFMLNIFLNTVIKQNSPALYYSMEMDKSQLYICCAAIISGVHQNVIQTGMTLMEDDKNAVHDANKTILSNPNLFVNDSRSLSLSQIRAHMRKMCLTKGVKLFIIDYLQLINDIASADNKVSASGEVIRQLRQSAQDLSVHVIVGSQLKREVENRRDRRPKMSDLRESGNIEEYADRVWLLYRDDYYDDYSDQPDILEIIVDKQRSDGMKGIIKLHFDKPTGRVGEVKTGFNRSHLNVPNGQPRSD